MVRKEMLATLVAVAALVASAVPVLAANGYGFATVDAKGHRKVFGPYSTLRRCQDVRGIEATTDRWRMVSECGETTSTK